jgi:hypothetical protein
VRRNKREMPAAKRVTTPVRARVVGLTKRRNRWAGNVSVRSATPICTFNTPASDQGTGDILAILSIAQLPGVPR